MPRIHDADAAKKLEVFHPCAVARLRWRIEHPSPDEIALNALTAMAPRVGAASDTDVPGTWGAVMAVAQGKRDRLERAYRRLIDE
jgi:hypothetical protein